MKLEVQIVENNWGQKIKLISSEGANFKECAEELIKELQKVTGYAQKKQKGFHSRDDGCSRMIAELQLMIDNYNK